MHGMTWKTKFCSHSFLFSQTRTHVKWRWYCAIFSNRHRLINYYNMGRQGLSLIWSNSKARNKKQENENELTYWGKEGSHQRKTFVRRGRIDNAKHGYLWQDLTACYLKHTRKKYPKKGETTQIKWQSGMCRSSNKHLCCRFHSKQNHQWNVWSSFSGFKVLIDWNFQVNTDQDYG